MSKSVERTTYVLLASLVLLLLFWQWRPMPAVVWQVADPHVATAVTVLAFVGWLIVLVSTFLVNHFELFGLQQVANNLVGHPMPAPRFRTPLLYGFVRHPIYLGFVIAFWAAPTMSVGHVLFAAVTTAYIIVAIQLEERDLIEVFGDEYRRYRGRVSMLVPWPSRPRNEGMMEDARGRIALRDLRSRVDDRARARLVPLNVGNWQCALKARMPDDIAFETKPEIVVEQVPWAREAGLPHGVVLMDAGYGASIHLRTSITALDLNYVAGTQPNTTVWTSGQEPLPPKKLRWRIGRDYLELKQEVGLGHFEGREWRGFHHYATPSIAAAALAKTLFPEFALPRSYRPRGSVATAPRPKLDGHLAPTADRRARRYPVALPLLCRREICTFTSKLDAVILGWSSSFCGRP